MKPLGWMLAVGLGLFAGCVDGGPPAEDVDASVPDLVPDVGGNETVPVDVAILAVSNGFYPANPAFVLDVSEIPAGARVTLTYSNEDLNPLGKHNWFLEGVEGAETDVIETGQRTEIAFDAPLAPGAYAYYCSVPTHRDRGMVGELQVMAA